MTAFYRRIAAVDEEEFEDDLVVMNTATHAVVTLNCTARVVWEALAEGATRDDLLALFATVLPGTAPEDLRRDIVATLTELEGAGLLIVRTTDGDRA
ncbi:MAG: PqqD family protein [Alphaproteobacteria bacterium]